MFSNALMRARRLKFWKTKPSFRFRVAVTVAVAQCLGLDQGHGYSSSPPTELEQGGCRVGSRSPRCSESDNDRLAFLQIAAKHLRYSTVGDAEPQLDQR
jgi:hypothetical protein